MEPKITEYKHNNDVLARVEYQGPGYKQILPQCSDVEIEARVLDLTPSERLYMKREEFGLARAVELVVGKHPDTYITNEDIRILVAEGGYKTKTEISLKDRKLGRLVRERKIGIFDEERVEIESMEDLLEDLDY